MCLAVFHLSVLLITTEFAAHEGRTWSLQKFLRLTKKGWNAYNLYTNSLSFWPIYHRWSTDIPPTINGQRIGRESAFMSTEISADSWSICRPSLGRYLGWYIGRYVDRHISVDISTDTWPICRLTLGRYVNQYIGRVLVDMSTDISVEECTKYTWSQGCCMQYLFWQKFIFLHLFPKQAQDTTSDQENHSPPNGQSLDIEDIASRGSASTGLPVATKRKHGQMTLGSSSFKSKSQKSSQLSEGQLSQTWKEVLGEPPQWGPNKVKIVSLGQLTVA